MATDKVTLSCAQITRPDLSAVDQLAHIQLGVRRGGRELCLADASYELMALIDFAGLGEVLRVEVQRQSEERKELRGVEEKRELPDPPVL
jgi:ABC-type transporter Mla MlaB component